MSDSRNGIARRGRAGFTLLEMLVVVVLLGLVLGVVMRVVVGQQRFYRGAADLMSIRGQMRQAHGVLPADLRGISSVGEDITAFTDSSITFRTQVGSSIVCSVNGALPSSQITIPPTTLQKRHKLTSWLDEPGVGDRVIIYDDGWFPGNGDDSWSEHTITAWSLRNSTAADRCLPTTGYTTALDAADSYRINVTPALPGTIVQGAPVRFVKTVRYRLYQAADTEWYIGFQDSTAAGWSATYPVSGPHRAYSATAGESGLTFAYFDNTGTALSTATYANRLLVARIDVGVRGRTDAVIEMPGIPRDQYADSLTTTVGLRNWR